MRNVTTAGGQALTVFAKNGKWAAELYADLVAPYLQQDLYVETWIRPPAVRLTQSGRSLCGLLLLLCGADYPVGPLCVAGVRVSTVGGIRCGECEGGDDGQRRHLGRDQRPLQGLCVCSTGRALESRL